MVPTVVPLHIFAIKAVAWCQGLLLIRLGRQEIRELRRGDVCGSSLASPGVLLVYRLAMLALCLSIGVPQLAARGLWIFTFFTVWNWWLLTLFFAAATASSLRSWRLSTRPSGPATRASSLRNAHPSHGPRARQLPADWLDRVAATAFHVIIPIATLIDLATWLLLVPMLMRDPDPVKRAHWAELMFSFSSYMQHGGNVVMMAGDLLLNRIPLMFYWGKAWITLWFSLFGLWSIIFFTKTGRFIYPFLDFHSPAALGMYLGVFGVMWALFGVFVAAVRGRDRLGARRRWRRQS